MNSLVPSLPKTIARAVVWAIAWPLLALIGVAVAAAWLLRVTRGLARAARVRQQTLVCPRGHRNEVIGRWACDRCGAEYLGWVGSCGVCGDESADWTACQRCGLAIRLPWRARA